jgi:hypothetical protein
VVLFTFFDRDAPASDVYESKDSNIGIFIMMGILFQIILEFFLGAEHSRTRTSKHESYTMVIVHQSLHHAFLEGFL